MAKEDVTTAPIVVIDAGHTKSHPGALGAEGVYEVEYNDNLVAQLVKPLAEVGVKVILTKQPGEEISLERRAEIANIDRANLFLSIHHDSAQPVYLNQTTFNNLPAYKTKQPIAGFSIFISTKNPQFKKSEEFAELLGAELLKLGRKPTLHHAEKIAGENRLLLNPTLGIYQFDDLIVLKKTSVPAVLLEVGVIVDEADEKYVSDKDNQQHIVHAIVNAIQSFNRTE
ncbi:N-acetylmuramoyl-L-alanine amidase family protein [Collimonas arenae]|uniref:N-acetylmuramoyl-L-alanine amidase family protein n=1 Tax=Collimonas arenae TaxID=279058 RepID=UPI0018D28963|nr:N-acetylmuramoyl-L-alanine amidase [Collimonas arenae]